MGITPGGATPASFMSYGLAKKMSKSGASFGTGQIEGVVHGAGDLGKVLAGLPTIAARSVAVLNQFDAITRDGLVLSPETVEAIGKAEARRVASRRKLGKRLGDLLHAVVGDKTYGRLRQWNRDFN